MSVNSKNTPRLKRLHFRCWHRGTKENDLLLGQFADHCLEKLDENQLKELENLLEENDIDIYKWVVNKEKPEFIKNKSIIDKLRTFYHEKKNINFEEVRT